MTPSMPPQSSPVADSPFAKPADPNMPTVQLPAASSASSEHDSEMDDEDASNQPTVGLPTDNEPAKGDEKPAPSESAPSEPGRPDTSYRTVLLPTVSPEELQKQKEEWQRLADGEPATPAKSADTPGSEGATIMVPGQEPAGEGATIVTPGATGNISSEGTPTIFAPSGAPLSGDSPTILPPSSPTPRVPTPPPFAPPADQPTGQQERPTGGFGAVPPYNAPNQPVAPSYGASNLPPAAPPFGQSAAPAAPPASNRRQLYWIIGGVGCLLLVLLAACVIFFLVVLSNGSTGGGLLLAAATATVPIATLTPRPTSVAVTTIATPAPVASGNVAFSDDFSSPDRSSLAVGDDKETSYAFEDGVYVITVKVPRLIAWSAFDGTYSDVNAHVEATLRDGPNDASAALLFRYQDSSNFYVYNIAGDGRYNLEVMQNNNLTTLIDWTPSPAIKQKGETNLMRVEMKGPSITLYVNDTKLEETSDNTFLKGQMALAANTFDQGGAKVVFDNLVVEKE